MRISDWSSDVCSSDLDVAFRRRCQHDIGAADRTDITRSRHGICDRRPGSSRAGRHDRSDPACRECGCAPPPRPRLPPRVTRSVEHTSELQSLMRISYAVFCLTKHSRRHATCNHSYRCALLNRATNPKTDQPSLKRTYIEL